MILGLILTGWALCSFLSYGFLIGTHRKASFNYLRLRGMELVWLGPCALVGVVIGSLICGMSLGFSLRYPTTEERKELFIEKFPSLASDPELLKTYFE